MENILNLLLESDLETFIRKRTGQLLQLDETYLHDAADLKELEDQVYALSLDRGATLLLQDYLACYETTQGRKQEIAYIAGLRDAVQFFHKTNLFTV